MKSFYGTIGRSGFSLVIDRIELVGRPEEVGSWAVVELRNKSARWPVCIRGGDRTYVCLSDTEAVQLMQILQRRYPLEALSDA